MDALLSSYTHPLSSAVASYWRQDTMLALTQLSGLATWLQNPLHSGVYLASSHIRIIKNNQPQKQLLPYSVLLQ